MQVLRALELISGGGGGGGCRCIIGTFVFGSLVIKIKTQTAVINIVSFNSHFYKFDVSFVIQHAF